MAFAVARADLAAARSQESDGWRRCCRYGVGPRAGRSTWGAREPYDGHRQSPVATGYDNPVAASRAFLLVIEPCTRDAFLHFAAGGNGDSKRCSKRTEEAP